MSLFFLCSKTCVLQLYSYHVSDECAGIVCLWTYGKWSWICVLVCIVFELNIPDYEYFVQIMYRLLIFSNSYLQVIWGHYCLLPCLLSSSFICNISSRLLPGHHPSSIDKCSLSFFGSHIVLVCKFFFLVKIVKMVVLSWLLIALGWQEDDLHLENVYYSEMKDAGFFDADWEWCSNRHIEDGRAFQNSSLLGCI